MKAILVVLTALVFFSVSTDAQGKKFTIKDHGINFVAPKNWTTEVGEGNCPIFTISNPDRTITIYVMAAHTDSLVTFFNEEYNIKGTRFEAQGSVANVNGYQGLRFLRNQNGAYETLDAILKPITEKESVVVLTYMSSSLVADEAKTATVQLVNSIKLTFGRKFREALRSAEETIANNSSGGVGGGRQSKYGGRSLYYENPRTGTQLKYDLCSSGAAIHTYSGYGTSITKGSWSLQNSGDGEKIVVRIDGEVKVFDVTSSGIFLNGVKYVWDTNTECD